MDPASNCLTHTEYGACIEHLVNMSCNLAPVLVVVLLQELSAVVVSGCCQAVELRTCCYALLLCCVNKGWLACTEPASTAANLYCVRFACFAPVVSTHHHSRLCHLNCLLLRCANYGACATLVWLAGLKPRLHARVACMWRTKAHTCRHAASWMDG